jgi:hypothetical protein
LNQIWKIWEVAVPTVPMAVPNGTICADGDTVGTASPRLAPFFEWFASLFGADLGKIC